MAYRRDITEDDMVFKGTDLILSYTIYSGNPSAEEIAAGTASPEDVTGWQISWTLRKQPNSPDPALIEKTNDSGGGIDITGTWGSDAASSTQRIEVTLSEADTYDPTGSPAVDVRRGTYAYALRRTDTGSKAVLAFGSFRLQQAA
jgi:hypothetical protein